jgi:hypothetical protein
VSTPGRENNGIKRRIEAARNSGGISGKTDAFSLKKQSITDTHGGASDYKNSTGGFM